MVRRTIHSGAPSLLQSPGSSSPEDSGSPLLPRGSICLYLDSYGVAMQSSRLYLVAGPAVEQPVRGAVHARAVEVRVLEGTLYSDWQRVYEENVLSVYRQIFARVGNRPDA